MTIEERRRTAEDQPGATRSGHDEEHQPPSEAGATRSEPGAPIKSPPGASQGPDQD